MKFFIFILLAFNFCFATENNTKIIATDNESIDFFKVLTNYGIKQNNTIIKSNSDSIIRQIDKSGYFICLSSPKRCQLLENLDTNQDSTWPPKYIINKTLKNNDITTIFNFLESQGYKQNDQVPKIHVWCYNTEMVLSSNIDRHIISPTKCEMTLLN